MDGEDRIALLTEEEDNIVESQPATVHAHCEQVNVIQSLFQICLWIDSCSFEIEIEKK